VLRRYSDAAADTDQLSGVLTSGLENIPAETVGIVKTVRVTVQNIAFGVHFVSYIWLYVLYASV